MQNVYKSQREKLRSKRLLTDIDFEGGTLRRELDFEMHIVLPRDSEDNRRLLNLANSDLFDHLSPPDAPCDVQPFRCLFHVLARPLVQSQCRKNKK